MWPPKTDSSRWRVLKKMWSTGEGNGKPLHHSCLENPMNSMKRQKDMTLKDKFPKLVDAQYATEEQRNSSRMNEEAEPKWKWCPVVDVSGSESKVWCCQEQYCMGSWNIRSMNQGELEVVKQEMARVNINILGISELKWTWMGKFNSDYHYIYYCGKESLRRNGVALTVHKSLKCSTWIQSQKWQNDLGLFSSQAVQYHSNTSLCPNLGFPGGSDGKVSAHNAGDPGSIPGLGRSPGEGNGNPLQYSCLENSMDGGAWWGPWGPKELDTTERLHFHFHMPQSLMPEIN